MALAHPSSPELKRYTFFVSRQREDGRERFLHMGYFGTQEQAEEVLVAVRDVISGGMGRSGAHAWRRTPRQDRPVQLAPAGGAGCVAAVAPSRLPRRSPRRFRCSPLPPKPPVVADARPEAVVRYRRHDGGTGHGRACARSRPMSDMRNVMAHLDSDTTQIQQLPAAPPAEARWRGNCRWHRRVRWTRRACSRVAPKVAANKAAAKELTPVQESSACSSVAAAVVKPMNLAVPVAKPLPAVQDD